MKANDTYMALERNGLYVAASETARTYHSFNSSNKVDSSVPPAPRTEMGASQPFARTVRRQLAGTDRALHLPPTPHPQMPALGTLYLTPRCGTQWLIGLLVAT